MSMMGKHSNTNFAMIEKLQRSLPKLVNKLDLDTVFLMDWKGHTYNIVPFVCAGLSFFGEKEIERTYAVKCIHYYVQHNSEEIVADLKDGIYQTIKDSVDERELATFNILSRNPNPSRGSLSTMAYYLYSKDKRGFITLMLGVYNGLLGELVMNKRPFEHWKNNNCKEMGNQEAFSFYIGLSWLIKIEPRFKMYLGKFLKHLDLKEKYNEFCPDNCYLDRVLTEEIATKDIENDYYNKKAFSDKSSYYIRDLVLTISDGEYDGHDLSDEFCDVLNCLEFREKDYLYGESQLAYFMSCFDMYEATNSIEQFEKDLEEQSKEINKAKKSIEKQGKLVEKYQEKINTLQDENQQLRYELGNKSTDEELQAQIEQLNEEIKALKQENYRFEHTHLRDKQEISLLRKKVGKIESKEIQDKLDIYESDDLIQDEDDITLDQKIDILKDKKIILLGLDFLTPTVQRMEELGFTDVTLCSKDTKKPGKFDICVVLATRCMHDVVRRMETFADKYDALWLYSASTNAEKIIDLMYEYSKEDEEPCLEN